MRDKEIDENCKYIMKRYKFYLACLMDSNDAIVLYFLKHTYMIQQVFKCLLKIFKKSIVAFMQI